MKKFAALILGLLLVLAFSGAAGAAETVVEVSPGTVDIGLTFRGADLNISGTVPEGSDVYLKITSPNDMVLELNKKGKVGFFWMNVEKADVTDVPKLYRIVSSAGISRLPGDLRQQLGLGPDFSQILSGARVTRQSDNGPVRLSGEDAGQYISSLINTYEKSGLYGVSENSVNIEGSSFRAAVKLPSSIPHEKCSVTVYAVKDGQLVGTAGAAVAVSGVGLAKWLNWEEIYDGPMFGLIAVIIALVFGVGIALLFSCIENLLSGGGKTGFQPDSGH